MVFTDFPEDSHAYANIHAHRMTLVLLDIQSEARLAAHMVTTGAARQ